MDVSVGFGASTLAQYTALAAHIQKAIPISSTVIGGRLSCLKGAGLAAIGANWLHHEAFTDVL